MGETDGENKAEGGGGKKDEVVGPTTAVLKLDLHCEGCAKKVKRAVRNFEGVEKVKVDCSANKLTVTGNVDPAWLRERVEYKTKKTVELVSPQPKKKADDNNEKSDKKPEEKKADHDEKPKEPTVSTVVMKIKLHCNGCAHKVKRAVLKNIDGVNSVKTDLQKDLVTVTGTMEVTELAAYLQQKLKKSIEIILPKKDGGGGEKKVEKEGDAKSDSGTAKETKPAPSSTVGVGGGEGSKGSEGTTKVEVNKMEYNSYNPQTYFAMPMYNQSYANHDYGVEAHHQHHHQGYAYHGYPQTSYAVQYAQGPPPPPPTYLNVDDQIFSDENPNGCSLM